MKHLFLLFFLTSANFAVSQNYFYLEEIKLKKKDDFVDHQKNIIIAIDYMTGSAIDEKDMDRKACMRFIIRYAEKTTQTITIGSDVAKISDKNPDFLVLYMGLWLKSNFNNKTGTDDNHKKYAFTEIYKYIKRGNNVTSTDEIKSFLKAGDENKIDDWIKENNK